jgi:hypothetical protein
MFDADAQLEVRGDGNADLGPEAGLAAALKAANGPGAAEPAPVSAARSDAAGHGMKSSRFAMECRASTR